MSGRQAARVPFAELLARASGAYRAALEAAGEGRRAPRKALVQAISAAVSPLSWEPLDAGSLASLCFALIDWSDGLVHPWLAEAASSWNQLDLPRHGPASRLGAVGQVATELRFASFEPERLLYGAVMPRMGSQAAHAQVIEGGSIVAKVKELGVLLLLPSGVAYTARTAEGSRVFVGEKKSRPFDRIEQLALLDDGLVAVVRKGKARGVLFGERFSGGFDEVRLLGASDAPREAAPGVLLPELEGPLTFAARKGKRWRTFERFVPGPERDSPL